MLQKSLRIYILAAFIIAVVAAVFVNRSYKAELREIDRQLYSTCVHLKNRIPEEYFDRAVTPDAIPPEEYVKIARTAANSAQRGNVTEVYAMTKQDGRYYHVVSSDYDGVGDYFAEYADDWQQMKDTFEDGIIRYDNNVDSSGVMRSCVMRYVTSKGTRYIIGADIPFRRATLLMYQQLFTFLPQDRIQVIFTFTFLTFLVLLSVRLLLQKQYHILFFGWISVLLVLSFGFHYIFFEESIESESRRQMLLDKTVIFARETQELNHAAIKEPLEPHTDGEKAYNEIIRKHRLWCIDDRTVMYIYTLRPIRNLSDKKLQFICSCPSDINRDGKLETIAEIGDLPFSPYYEELPTNSKPGVYAWQPAYEKAFEGFVVVDPPVSSGIYGGEMFVTSAAPLFDKQGNIEAIFCIDVSTEEWERIINPLKNKSYYILFSICVFLLSGTGFLSVLGQMLNYSRQQNTVLEKANRAKSAFLANMSHEMRTPLNTIIGMVQVADMSQNTGKILACVSRIGIAARHMLVIIDDILNMAKLENSTLTLKTIPFGLDEVVSAVKDIIEPLADEKRQIFSIEQHPLEQHNEESKQIIGDPFWLTQVLQNLLDNAVRFTSEGGTVRLDITELPPSAPNTARFRFSVTDTGIGIADEDLKRIFNMFEQGDNRVVRSFSGTGLGLAIVRYLVLMMGGQVSVESKVGEGSCFSFELSLESSKTVNKQGEEDVPTQIIETSLPDYSNYRILAADDAKINLIVLKQCLEKTKVQIDEVYNGEEAVKKVLENPQGYYSLVFMDIQMPVMDGCTATEMIRASEHPDAKTLPIYAMTANVFSDDVEAVMKAGMNGHIGKPIDFKTVIRTLKKCFDAV